MLKCILNVRISNASVSSNLRTKLAFASTTDSYYIRFGRLNDMNIKAGQLKLSG